MEGQLPPPFKSTTPAYPGLILCGIILAFVCVSHPQNQVYFPCSPDFPKGFPFLLVPPSSVPLPPSSREASHQAAVMFSERGVFSTPQWGEWPGGAAHSRITLGDPFQNLQARSVLSAYKALRSFLLLEILVRSLSCISDRIYLVARLFTEFKNGS